MSQDHTKAGVEQVYIQKLGLAAKQYSCDQACSDHLACVTQEYDQSGLFAHHTQDIGAAGVSTSVIADIHMLGSAVKIAGLKQAKHVSH